MRIDAEQSPILPKKKKRFTFRIKGVDPWYGYTEAFKIAHHVKRAYVVSCEESRHSLLKLPTMLGNKGQVNWRCFCDPWFQFVSLLFT